MARLVLWAGFGAVLGIAMCAATGSAADPPPDSGSSPSATDRGPDFTGYTFVADVVGEIVKASDSSITLRITWYVPQASNNRNHRPRLSSNNRNFRNPYSMRRRTGTVKWKEQHHDYDLQYIPASLVRNRHLPPKLDENGKKAPHTEKELNELRKPLGTPGYAAEKADLKPGTIVEVYLIRDRSVPVAKMTEGDIRLKYVFILGQDPNPPKTAATPKKKK